jgi:hypothetical protein
VSRFRTSLLAGALTIGAGVVALPASPSAAAEIPPSQAITFDHLVRNSSPAVGDVNGDGTNDLVLGGEDGIVRVYRSGDLTSLLWQAPAVPHIAPGCAPQSGPTAIDSSALIADVDGDGANEVVVGMQSVYVENQNGGLVVFNRDGSVKWKWQQSHDVFNVWNPAGGQDGYCEGVYATSSVGDVNGDGRPDVVFAGWDQRIWALDGRNGAPISGFPFENHDTVWSSPALFDVDGDGKDEIFVGGDDTCCWNGHEDGGQVHALDWENGTVVERWKKMPDEAVMGSPAIGDINGDGRMEMVVTTARNYQTIDSRRIFAWHLDDGSTVPGWPQAASSFVTASPALGDLNGDGVPEVIVGSWDRGVYAFRGDGSLLWRSEICCNPADPSQNRVIAGAVVGDLDGDGDNDVAVGSGWSVQLLNGQTGAKMSEGVQGYSMDSSPVLADFGARGRHLIAVGYSIPANRTTVASYRISSTASIPWPGFRGVGGGRSFAVSCPAPNTPTSPAALTDASGYWMLGRGGSVYAFGGARNLGNPALGGSTAVDLEPTPTGRGYWVLDSRGCVQNFGDAVHHGNVPSQFTTGGERVTSLSAVGTSGYYAFTNRGRAIPLGSATHLGDMSAVTLNGPVLGSVVTPSGRGYYMVASDGGIFAFGDAQFHGSMGGRPLNQPVQGLVPTASGRGYWLVASDGGVFAFGDADFRGSMGSIPLNAPVVGLVRYGNGYLMVATDGGIFSFSDREFRGSLGSNPPASPIVTAAALP